MNFYLNKDSVSDIPLSPSELLLSLCNQADSEDCQEGHYFADTPRLFAALIASPRVLFMSPTLTDAKLFNTGLVDEDDTCLLCNLLHELEKDNCYAVVTAMERGKKHMVLEMFNIYPDSQGVIDTMIRKHMIDSFLKESI